MTFKKNCMWDDNSHKPLLRWAGSKKRQANKYASYFPSHFNSYVEPFAGSASFCFCLGLNRAKLNDINFDLINFYRQVQNRPLEIWQDFLKIHRDYRTYYKIREGYNICQDQYMKAVLFYYINRNCFNGIYRVNKAGEFNVPFSNDRVSSYLTDVQFENSAFLIAGAQIRCTDFAAFCRAEVERGDFVFLDPPYAIGGSKHFQHYNSAIFSQGDLDRLVDLLVELESHGAKFMLSFPDSPFIHRLGRWNSATVDIRRTIAGRAAFRGMAKEILVYNYDV